MFKLESNRLKREFKIVNGNFFASQILNKYSDMTFIPDGNGCEFVIRFADGDDFSAKGLSVVDSSADEGKLRFVFQETKGISVTLEMWIHPDGNTICKQLTLDQNDSKVIDFVYLDSVGIINSKTHLGAELVEGSQLSPVHAALGQPFYIDSLFFGCEFPATDNRISHGVGRIKYYIGKNVGKGFKCPVTVMGAAKSNTVYDVKRAFFEYLDTIKLESKPRYQYNCWYDNFAKISSESVTGLFGKISDCLKENGIEQLDAYTVDDGWESFKSGFWGFNKKTFPNGLNDVKAKCDEIGTGLGLWLSPRGGYTDCKKFAKKLIKSNSGFLNKEAEEICVASARYTDALCEWLCEVTNTYNLSYLKLDGFALKPCKDETHDHLTGGENDMYYVTDLWHSWIELFKRLRASGDAGRNVFINLTCFVNPSPWWLQWVNSIWLQNSDDIGFAENQENQSRLDSELTYRDTRYYDTLCARSAQLPLSAVYNHEPIYGNKAKSDYSVEYSDAEFEKYVIWNAVRGAALNELHLSPEMMNENKWKALKASLDFHRESFDIMKQGMFIGGRPDENNIYGYVGWTQEGEGIIALRNPTDETTPLTLTFNRLMGVPESFAEAEMQVIYGKPSNGLGAHYNYNDKLSLTLEPFDTIILKFTRQRD